MGTIMQATDMIDGNNEDWKALRPQRVDRQVSYQTEVITPQRARDLIATMPSMPRTDERAVKYYQSIIENNGWVENGNPIILGENDMLIDGYHRLLAVIRADKSIRSMVARGARPDTIHTIDQHRRRTFTGVLESRGVVNAGDVHRALTKLIRYENGLLIKTDYMPGWSRLDMVFDKNQDIIEASAISQTVSQACTLPPKMRTAFIFMALKAGLRQPVMNFLRSMTDDSLPATNPARMLQFNIQSIVENTSVSRADPDVALALAILAFNDFVAGKQAGSIYAWKPDYGKDVKLNAAGKPVSPKAMRKSAPPNCGMPTMVDYPGLTKGKIEDFSREESVFSGDTAETLMRIADHDHEIKVVMALVTPEIAQMWLLRYNKGNRKIQKTHITRISRDIKLGNWMVNLQPIAFHGNPFKPENEDAIILLNGQHRLKACVEAGTPIEVPIAINIPKEAFPTYDQSMKRQKGSVGGDDRVVRSAAVLQWREDMNLTLRDRDRPTATEILRTVEQHPMLVEFAEKIRRKEGKGRPDAIAPGAVLTYFLYRIHRENERLAERFFDGMRSGANLESGNPILSLRNYASQHRRGATRLNRYDALDMLLSHWGRYLKWVQKKDDKASQPDLI